MRKRDEKGKFLKDIDNDSTSKICNKCKKNKELSEFHKGCGSKGVTGRCKECRNETNREKYKETFIYDEKQKEKQRKRWINRDVDKVKAKAKIYRHKRLKEDDIYKLSIYIRASINKHLKRKNKKTIEILGCTIGEFKIYLESKFEPWMNWENRGLYNNEFNYGWDLDHIIPLSTAKSEEDIIKLNHYTNFQPLCSKVNRYFKKDKINYVNRSL